MIIRCYYIWPRFPSISLSGPHCAMSCAHCDQHYLSCMTTATTPETLLSTAESLESGGARGLLLSGGCDTQGRMLNLPKLLPMIRRIKRETDLVIKLHTGLVDRELAEGIVSAEVDVASMEFVGAKDSIREVFGLPLDVNSYITTFRNLQDAGMPHISPHICVGLQHGKLLGEFTALNLLKETIDPESIAIIVFRPTKGTPMGDLPPPPPDSVGRVVAHARKLFPMKKILLGSLRPRLSGKENMIDGGKDSRLGIELAALNNGADAVEIPSPGMIRVMRDRGYRLKRIEAFGILPETYEERIGSSWM
jgi:lipoyl synthase